MWPYFSHANDLNYIQETQTLFFYYTLLVL